MENERPQQPELNALYRDLHRIAAAHMRAERAGHTLQPTAVAHEAWLRMQAAGSELERARFMGLASQVVRRVLVDHARRRNAAKRDAGPRRVRLTDSLVAFETEEAVDLLELDRALERLAERSARQAKVVELRYFSGLSQQETAEVLCVSRDTVKRDWRLARAWLNRALREEQT